MFLFNDLFVLLPLYNMVTRMVKDNRSATARLLICCKTYQDIEHRVRTGTKLKTSQVLLSMSEVTHNILT